MECLILKKINFLYVCKILNLLNYLYYIFILIKKVL